ncbi:lipopolysaccharide kinase InaA family protein [Alloalcanivorax mobilis]|uniref:lipopolysaccharide kinase InaA family protein n=1 Tax=Alloalcanivorax mobilis TaxID=2019569 RepID=UPI000B5B316C|nr:lipopolysaccharide kinase InaA family protein [Alloalcanivorax mobilis]ASK35499.1 hypothetical protein CEK62_14495 [Alcanivorax sp. N3-2A]|tara:strand:- start:4366 stop:5133 length:768 start_codon:yes stop_codon:yes gene_type:complete
MARAYLDPEWRAVLRTLGLDTLRAWWQGDKGEPVDEPNVRYGGELAVYRVQLPDGEGRTHNLYVKCQRNQHHRTPRHPLWGEPTLHAEFRALRRCLAQGIPVAPPVFFDTLRDAAGDTLTVMVSLGLDGFDSLDRIELAALPVARRWRLIEDVASTVRFMHERGYVHRNLYPKHVFVAWRAALGCYDVRFIDLEKTHRVFRRQHLFRDLESLARRGDGVRERDGLRFLRHYLGTPRLHAKGRELARRLAAKRPQR